MELYVTRLEVELSRFRWFGSQKTIGGQTVRWLDDWILILEPADGKGINLGTKTHGISFLGTVHGNEVGGLAVLNGILEMILDHGIHLPFSTTFAIGNVSAANAGVRFLERDLNRSFGGRTGQSLEEMRAKQLEPILASSAFFVDFHQTTEHSDRPFFIFPFQPAGFAFANRCAPHVSIVTHWGDPFSSEGMCSDEYVNGQGGVGITLELGQSGFHPWQISQGIVVGMQAFKVAERVLTGKDRLAVDTTAQTQQIFTWERVMPYPKGKEVDLVPGLYNFRSIEAGFLLGHIEGEPLHAPAVGHILFPKYKKPQDKIRPPTEICRMMKEITVKDLPSS